MTFMYVGLINLQASQLKPNVPVQRFVDNMPAECANAGCTDR